jgi:hypothetical protein
VFWTWWLGDLAGALVVVTNLRRSRAAAFDLHLVEPVDPVRLIGLLADRTRRPTP